MILWNAVSLKLRYCTSGLEYMYMYIQSHGQSRLTKSAWLSSMLHVPAPQDGGISAGLHLTKGLIAKTRKLQLEVTLTKGSSLEAPALQLTAANLYAPEGSQERRSH